MSSEDVYAILPVNQLSKAKTRLASVLTQEERGELVLTMLGDVLDALEGLKVIIISPDELVGQVDREGVEFIIEDEKKGLAKAVEEANRYAMEREAAATLFIPIDTPLIKTKHVEDILTLGQEHPLVLVPSNRGGVGPIYRRPPDVVRERFSSRSFDDFQEEAHRTGIPVKVYESFELALDIDTPDDIKEFMAHGRGTKTHAYLLGRSFAQPDFGGVE